MKRKLTTILFALLTSFLLALSGPGVETALAAGDATGRAASASNWGTCPVTLTGDVLTVSAGVGEDTGHSNPFTAWGNVGSIVFEDGVVLPADCSALLSNCSFSTVTFGQVDTSRVVDMSAMFFFNEEAKIKQINGLTCFDTSSVTSMQSMFAGCAFLETLDLSSFVISPSADVSFMFEGCLRLRQVSFGSNFILDPDMMFPDTHVWLSETDENRYTCADIIAQRAGIADTYIWPQYPPADYSQFQMGFDGVVTGYDDYDSAWNPLNPLLCNHPRALWTMEVQAEDDYNCYYVTTDIRSDKYNHTITGYPVRVLYCPDCQQDLSAPTAMEEEMETYTEPHMWGYEWDPVLDDDVPSGICMVCEYACLHDELISYSVSCTPRDIGDDEYHALDFPGATTDVVCRICGKPCPGEIAPARTYQEAHNYENGVCTDCGHVRSCTHPHAKTLADDEFVTYREDPVTGDWGGWLYGAPQYANELYHKVECDIRAYHYCPDCGEIWEDIAQRKVERLLPHHWYMDNSTRNYVCADCGATNPCSHSRLTHVEYLTDTGVISDSFHRNDTHRAHSQWVLGDYCDTCGLLFNARNTSQTVEVPHIYDSDGFCRKCLHICTHTGDAVQTTAENIAYTDCTAAAHTKSWDARLPDTCPYCAMALGGQVRHVEEVQPHAYASSGVCTDCGFDLFAETANLPVMSLPENLRQIDESAFDGSAAAVVIVPDGCEVIGARAFANCPALTIIRLPDSVTGISVSAFDGCKDYVIVAPSGSTAIDFAVNSGIQYVAQ